MQKMFSTFCIAALLADAVVSLLGILAVVMLILIVAYSNTSPGLAITTLFLCKCSLQFCVFFSFV